MDVHLQIILFLELPNSKKRVEVAFPNLTVTCTFGEVAASESGKQLEQY
jgi:hypothetical protein